MLTKIFIGISLIISFTIFTPDAFSEKLHKRQVSINVMPDLEPASFINKHGNPDGFFIRLIQEIAKKHNFKLVYYYNPWNKALEAVKNKQIDLLPSVIKTDQREIFLDYTSESIKTSWGEIFLPIDSKIESLLDLDGKRIGVMKADQNAANFKKIAKGFNLTCTYIEVNSQQDIVPLLEKKEVDAGVFFNTFIHNSNHIKDSTIIFNPVNLYFATAKNTNKELLELINSDIKAWKKDRLSPYYAIINQPFGKPKLSASPYFLKMLLISSSTLCLLLLLGIIILKYLINSQTKQLKKSQQRFKLAIDATNEGIWDWDISKDIIYWSNKSYNILGYTNEDFSITYETWKTLIHPHDLNVLENAIQKSINSQEAFSLEIRYKQKNGKWKWILTKGNSVETDKNNISTRIIGSHTDIDEQKKNQELLAEQKKQLRVIFDKSPSIMFLVNEQYQIINLNNPAQRLFNKNETTSVGMLKGELLNCANSLGADNIDKCGKTEKCKLCPLRNTIKETFKTKQNKTNVEFNLTTRRDNETKTQKYLLSTVHLYQNKQPTVLVNLNNLPTQEKEAKKEDNPKLNKASFIENVNRKIRPPINNILGFSSLLKNKNLTINEYEQYTSTIEANVNNLLKVVDELTSPQKKSHSDISLNLEKVALNHTKKNDPSKTAEEKSQKKQSLKTFKVLIAEDDLISYTLLSHLLKKQNIPHIHAKDGQEAIDMLQLNSDIDLILMDLKMPNLSGLEATKIIRETNKDIPIIAQSAYNHSKDIEKALLAGCNEFITKPIDPELLFNTIEKIRKKTK